MKKVVVAFSIFSMICHMLSIITSAHLINIYPVGNAISIYLIIGILLKKKAAVPILMVIYVVVALMNVINHMPLQYTLMGITGGITYLSLILIPVKGKSYWDMMSVG